MSTAQAAQEFLATDGPFRALKARHEAASKVLLEWFDEHPGKATYRGQVGFTKVGPWDSLNIAAAKKALGPKLADCLEDRYRRVLTALKTIEPT